MADYVKVKTLVDNGSQAVVLLSSSSDGTGESAIQKIDISALAMGALRVKITDILWACEGMQAELLFDHNTDDTAIILAGRGHWTEPKEPPILDPASAGGTGDILLTTHGQSAGDGYTILLTIKKVS